MGVAIIPRMLLAVDVGNTQTHIGAFDGEDLRRDWRLGTVPSATADELAATISHLLALDDLSFGSLDGAIVSTVVPQLGPEYEALTERHMGRACLLVGPSLKTGMPILVDNPHELGSRPARQRRRRPREGRWGLRGGRLRDLDELRRRLRRRRVPGRRDRPGGGDLDGGPHLPHGQAPADRPLGPAGSDRQAHARPPSSRDSPTGSPAWSTGSTGGSSEALGEEATFIATGGLAPTIAPHCETIDEVDPLLTLTGLRLIYGRNT